MAQLDDYPKAGAAILGSASVIVAFQVSAQDSQRYLAAEFGVDPHLGFDPTDRHTPRLTHIPAHHALTKIATKSKDETHHIFTYPEPKPAYDHGSMILDTAHFTYGTPRAAVEQYIRDWYTTDTFNHQPHVDAITLELD